MIITVHTEEKEAKKTKKNSKAQGKAVSLKLSAKEPFDTVKAQILSKAASVFKPKQGRDSWDWVDVDWSFPRLHGTATSFEEETDWEDIVDCAQRKSEKVKVTLRYRSTRKVNNSSLLYKTLD
jgi:hypothetical protein